MLPDKFSDEVKRTNLQYYEPRTEHGSSLSACMYSLLSCKVGEPDYAYPLFMKSAGVDLRKSGKEWAGLIYIGGTHPASEGGAWMVAIGGFAGMKIENGKISCSPWSDRENFAANLPKKYIMSNKPNPSYLAQTSFDEDVVRADLRRTVTAAKENGLCLELLLKDITTVCGDPRRLWRWSEIAVEECENAAL
jgi:hypothetical protein